MQAESQAMGGHYEHWPSEIRLRDDGRTLTVRFESGECYDLPAEYLRVMSPSGSIPAALTSKINLLRVLSILWHSAADP
jgi:DUF971 family protein